MSNEENPNSNEAQQECFPLDEAALSLLNDLDTQIRTLDNQWQGALVLFLRQHKLQGNWRLAPNRKELVRQPDVMPVMPQQ
jgi:hypothetical protein